MSDIKLFKIDGEISELEGKAIALEKSLPPLFCGAETDRGGKEFWR